MSEPRGEGPVAPSGSAPPRSPDDGSLARAVIASLVMLAALGWVVTALRITRDPVGAIDEQSGPIALIQFVIAALGMLSAWEALTRTHARIRIRQGEGPGAPLATFAVLFAIWAVLVLPGWKTNDLSSDEQARQARA
jgi:hypothetical protein